jgi:predicted membrane chloride channel (bestrophin family)
LLSEVANKKAHYFQNSSIPVCTGSAVFKSVTPAAASCGIFLILYYFTDLHEDQDLLRHPYAIGALVSALTFLLAFRANFSYNRYWEALTAVYLMHSKWTDVAMELAAFHLQSEVYTEIAPPAFGALNPLWHSLERERERLHVTTLAELQEQISHVQEEEENGLLLSGRKKTKTKNALRTIGQNLFSRKGKPRGSSSVTGNTNISSSCNHVSSAQNMHSKKELPGPPTAPLQPQYKSINSPFDPTDSLRRQYDKPTERITGRRRSFGRNHSTAATTTPPTMITSVKTVKSTSIEGSSSPLKNSGYSSSTNVCSENGSGKSSSNENKNARWDPTTPPLFLQEAAHLLSLLSAVSMSTLRNDLEQAGSPLISFIPGVPWPHVDPDDYGADVRRDWETSTYRSYAIIRYLLGISRTPHSRTLYNAARPFRVMGGVSDAEIELLQAARGPLAKVALCTMWLQEFITREYLAGSMGVVAAPILSRLFQFTSDGMVGYNQARKVAYIPFPFPHAQITSLFVFVVVSLMPVLMLSYVNHMVFALTMNIATVMCFSGLHEVARELESPFQNVPNDIPLNNFQAQFNEALMTMFAGYHPDAYWEVCETIVQKEPEPLPHVRDHERIMDAVELMTTIAT